MRAFIVSVLLAVVMILCTLLNNIYINKILDTMDLLASELPEHCGFSAADVPETVSAPARHWKKNLSILSCTVNMKYIDRISYAADEVISRYAAEDDSEYQAARTVLAQAISGLREAEKIGFTGIM